MNRKEKIIIILSIIIWLIILSPVIYYELSRITLPSNIGYKKMIFKDTELGFEIYRFTTIKDSVGLCFKEKGKKIAFTKPILMFDFKKDNVMFHIERKDNIIYFYYIRGSSMKIYFNSFKEMKLKFIKMSPWDFYQKGYLSN